MTAEYRIFGPPGTGKTTNLSRQIRRAVERFGAHSVLVTSFSRAAAAELAGRDLPISAEQIGTLHSHCYHALGAPAIAEANVDEWNRENPHLAITPVNKQGRLDGEKGTEDDEEQKDGDHWLRELNRFRGMMIPPEWWPVNVRHFASRWQQYKEAHGLMDFCDLIETCYRNVATAPKRPEVIFVDEAQDLSPLQMALIRKWGEQAQYFVVVGDEDQLLYSWCGCVPESLLDPPLPPDRIIILKQSYRVPRAVHTAANRLIRQVTRRQEKPYLPRPADGVSTYAGGTWRSPEYAILKAAIEHLERGQTVMFLASCSYMLRPVIQVLRKNGIAFHNPYRKANGLWNPLRVGRRGSAASRILALLVAHPEFGEGHRPWTHGDLALWAEWLCSKGILKRGLKSEIEGANPAEVVTIETLDQVFEASALEELLSCFEGDYRRLLDWWRRRLNASVAKRVEFPADIAMARGPQALLETPRVIVGTIHSVKGGEADVVFLFPDLSQAGDAAYQRFGPPRDAVIRTFYVGMTRAREVLYIADKASAMAAALPA
ncbi:MAG: UvrD-helicase domain-containing protein [Acidobacteriota bacterium]